MAIKTKPFDAAEYLDDAESQAELLSDAFDSGDAGYIRHALGVVAQTADLALADDVDALCQAGREPFVAEEIAHRVLILAR